jgi:hypothetical protein
MLLCLTAIGIAVSHVQGQGNVRPRRYIELTETNNAEILTNLNQLAVKKEGLRQLDDQLRLLKSSSSHKFFENRLSAPYVAPTTVPSKTIQELLEKHKNWALTPEELGMGLNSSDADTLKSLGDDKLDSKSSLQQFYDALNRSDSSRQNNGRSTDKNGAKGARMEGSHDDDFNSAADDPNLPANIRDKAQKLRDFVNQDSSSVFSQTRAHSSFQDFFGLSGNKSAGSAPTGTGEPKTKVDSFLEQFKKVLDGPTTASRIDPSLQSLLPTATTAQSAVAFPVLDAVPNTRHELTQTMPGNVNSIVDRTALQDINSRIVNQWNPMYTPPKIELPKYSPPSPPNVDFPRRKF